MQNKKNYFKKNIENVCKYYKFLHFTIVIMNKKKNAEDIIKQTTMTRIS